MGHEMGFQFFFRFGNKHVCLDATSGNHISRFINHSKKNPNVAPRLINRKGRPYIMFKTLRDIKSGDELLFDYNETDKEVIEANPWLKE